MLASFSLLTLVCLLSYFWADKPILLLMVTLPTAVINFFLVYTRLGEAIVYLLPAYLLLPLSFCAIKRLKVASYWQPICQKIFATSLLMASSITSSGAVVNGVKLLVGRYRPFYFLSKGLYGFQGPNLHQCMNSFPSGHSQAIWAAMVTLCFMFPKWRWVFIVFAITISFSRLITAYHYLSDVLMGGFLGVLSSVYFYEFLKKRKFFLKT